VGLVLHASIEEELSPYVEENGHREFLIIFFLLYYGEFLSDAYLVCLGGI
jgi:hypothetical protein